MKSTPNCKISLVAWFLLQILLLSACGGSSGGGNGGGGGGQPPPPAPDFSISSSASSVVLAPGSDSSFTVSIEALNAFTGDVSVALTGMPARTTASPSTFSLSPGSNQQVTLSAPANEAFASGTLSIRATSGSLSHNFQIPIVVSLVAQTSAHPPIRSRYIRTDSFYDPNSLQFFPPHFTVYDSADRLFFVSNPFANVIDVFDARLEIEVSTIPIPAGPWTLDLSPDNKTLYVGTILGDLYEVDPAALTVSARVPSPTIGPDGYLVSDAFALSDGRLALLGLVIIDGAPSFGIWNPKDNSLDVVSASNPNAGVCPGLIVGIGVFALSGDRTRVLVGSASSDGTLCSYDPATKQGTAGTFGADLAQITPTPDGKRFFATNESGMVQVFDATTVQKLGQFQGPVGPLNASPTVPLGIAGALMSLDGKTLYLSDFPYGDLIAYDSATFTQRGWVPNFTVADAQDTIVPGAIDETSLIVGPIGHGVAFVDGSQFGPGVLSPDVGLGFVNPQYGPVQGATPILVQTFSSAQNPTPSLSQAYLGTLPLTSASEISINNPQNVFVQATSPSPVAPGPVDFALVLSDSSVGIVPEGFSYGPAVVQIVPNAATADGGTTGVIFGYGFGATASEAHVTIGGKPAAVTSVTLPSVFPFPLEQLQFTIPPGTTGNADVTVSNSNGSVSVSGGFHYTPAAVIASFPNSSLQQGIFDPHRNQYYFADATTIRVLSKSGTKLTPFPVPGSNRLLSLSLSPNGSMLAVSDLGSKKIFVLNPGTPASIKAFTLPVQGAAPVGLAITNAGVVYFSTDNGQNDTFLFHRLDTSTGLATDLATFEGIGSPDADLIRVLLTSDGSRAYTVLEGTPLWVDTAGDQINVNVAAFNLSGGGSAPDFAMSADSSTFAINGFAADASLNLSGIFEYIDRETSFPVGTVGVKLSKDGRLFFQPLTHGIDIFDTQTGRLVYRVQIPGTIPDVYDALATDGVDNTIAVITTTGVALVSLDPLPLPQGRIAESTLASERTHLSAPTSRGLKPAWRRPQLKRLAIGATSKAIL
ncbi:MAG: IPT/TIG domain-containing protein [Candidatus Acidiferrales bacterium]